MIVSLEAAMDLAARAASSARAGSAGSRQGRGHVEDPRPSIKGAAMFAERAKNGILSRKTAAYHSTFRKGGCSGNQV